MCEKNNYHKSLTRNVRGFQVGGFKGVVMEFQENQNSLWSFTKIFISGIEKVVKRWKFKSNFWSFHIMVLLNEFEWIKPS